MHRLGADLNPLREANVLDEQQAALVTALWEQLRRQRQADPEFLPQAHTDEREFLFTTALETPEWHELRLAARRAHHAIQGERSPFIAIMAK